MVGITTSARGTNKKAEMNNRPTANTRSLLRAGKILSIAATVIVACVLSDSILAREQVTDQKATSSVEILLYSNDFSELVEEHWPRIRLGDVESMVIAYEALNTCSHFKAAISVSNDLDEFESAMAGQSAEMLKFGRGIFYKCKQLVERFDQYQGWGNLRLRSALAGHRGSRLSVVREFYRYRHERSREDFPFSPAEYVLEALDDRDPEVFKLITVFDAPWGLREQNGPVVSTAWGLVYCHYDGNCASRKSMERYCVFMAPECTLYENALEMFESKAGTEENLAAAQGMARELISAVEEERYTDLGLLFVY